MKDDTPATVIFLTRPGCSLCAEASPIVEREAAARGHSVETVDVTGTAWEAPYGDRVPVVIVDGVVVLAGRFGEAEVRRELG